MYLRIIRETHCWVHRRCENSSPLVLIVPVPLNTKFDDDPTLAID